jgi:hypothetical protein
LRLACVPVRLSTGRAGPGQPDLLIRLLVMLSLLVLLRLPVPWVSLRLTRSSGIPARRVRAARGRRASHSQPRGDRRHGCRQRNRSLRVRLVLAGRVPSRRVLVSLVLVSLVLVSLVLVSLVLVGGAPGGGVLISGMLEALGVAGWFARGRITPVTGSVRALRHSRLLSRMYVAARNRCRDGAASGKAAPAEVKVCWA